MRTEIYIEGRRLDLTQDLSAEFTYQIDDVKEFSSRESNFSKTIILPGTAQNNKQFGYVFEFGSGNFYDEASGNVGYNFNVSKQASCVVYVDRIQIFKGAIRLLEIIHDRGNVEYECAIFGELGGFIEAVANNKLEDLDFSTYDHYWTTDAIRNSWEYASGVTVSGMTASGYYPGSGYYYPLIDYGKVSTNKHDWDLQALRPALYVREYIDKIISNAGYTWEGDFLDTQLFRRLVIPNNQRTFSTLKSFNFVRRVAPSYEFNETDGTSKLIRLGISDIFADFTTNANNDVFTYTGANFSGEINIVINVGEWKKDTSIPFHLDVLVNGMMQSTITWESSSSFLFVPFSIDRSNPITLATNDTLSFQFRHDTASSFEIQVGTANGTFSIKTPKPVVVPYQYNDLISMNESSIPRGIFQIDFFSSIVKMFNLYVTETADKSKHLKITPYIQYYQRALEFLATDDFLTLFLVDDDDYLLLEEGNIEILNWTHKLDRSRPYRLKPMSELNGRYFEYKYKPDSDYYNEQYQKKYSLGYADRLEDTGYEFAKDKQTAEIIFSASALVGYDGEEKVTPAIFKLSNDVEDRTEHNIRILQVKLLEGVASWAIKNGSSTLVSVTSYGYGGHLDSPDEPQTDINFGAPSELYFELVTQYPSANLFNGYWSEYVAEITDKDSKLLTGFFRLNDVDILNLDFSKLIYIDGALWRLNKVIDYNPIEQDVTKVELLKVIELSYV